MTALGSIKWIALALLGLALAAGVSVAASQLISQRIGLAAEPVSASRELAPSSGQQPGGTADGKTGGGGGAGGSTQPSSTTTPSTTTLTPPGTTTPPATTAPPPTTTPPPTGSGGGSGEGPDD